MKISIDKPAKLEYTSIVLCILSGFSLLLPWLAIQPNESILNVMEIFNWKQVMTLKGADLNFSFSVLLILLITVGIVLLKLQWAPILAFATLFYCFYQLHNSALNLKKVNTFLVSALDYEILYGFFVFVFLVLGIAFCGILKWIYK